MRVICRFAPPPASLPAEDAALGRETLAGGGGEAGHRRGRADARSSLIHFRGGGRVSVWEEGAAGAREVAVDDVLPPTTSQLAVFEQQRALLLSVLAGENVTVLGYGPRKGGKSYTLFGRALRAVRRECNLCVCALVASERRMRRM